MGMLFLKKSLRETTRERDSLKKHPEKKDVGSMFFSQTSLADPPNGHQILKTTLADGSEAGFSRKTTKTITAFRLHFIPARHATKSRLPGTRSTAACLYIDDPSAFNPTISHSRSPADGADWHSWDTCAHNS